MSQSKKTILFSFCLTILVSVGLLFAAFPYIQAASTSVTSLVEAGDTTCTPACDDWNTTLCDSVGTKSALCTNADCSTTEIFGTCGGGNPGCLGTAGCSTGSCINGFKTTVCHDSCGVETSRDEVLCAPDPECGNNIEEAGEECDDGLTGSKNCSPSCELLKGCGDGQKKGGEECDDDNLINGDCCSDQCLVEVLLNVTSEIRNETSGDIKWAAACANLYPTTSQIEWGTTPDVNDGNASGFLGTPNSHSITDLDPPTTYNYKITAEAETGKGSQTRTATVMGVLPAWGVPEDCTNGIDDNGNGQCDYFGSTCTDGSVPGDVECTCIADFVCTPDDVDVCVDDLQVTTCVDQTVPKCEPDYSSTQSCKDCSGVTPGPCQDIDPDTCELTTRSFCCGNGTCEPGAPDAEDPVSCAVDCPVNCISDWSCTDWTPEPCPVGGGIQTRDCGDICEIHTSEIEVSRTCGGVCPGLSCGLDQTINIASCTCEAIVPFCGNAICELGENHSICPADCIEVCTPSWTCTAWSECVSGDVTKLRTCEDLNKCGLNLDRPPEVGSCTSDTVCSTCQVYDPTSDSCLNTSFCCGNRTCETNEAIWSCPVDCGLPPTFSITLSTCLDGKDNDGDGLADYPADPGCKKPTDSSELNLTEVLENITDFLQDNVLDNPAVEQVNETVAAPAIVAIATFSTFASFSFFNLFSYLQYAITQPFALLFRRKRKKWGTVYNSLTKQVIDLAIVRLYKQENGQLVRSRVTDKKGRYSFLVEPGKYYMTVTKPKFDFPSVYLKDKKEDGQYLDLYHGQPIEVNDKNVIITANIPIDAQVAEKPVRKVMIQYYLRKVQYAISFSAVPLAAISLVISPTLFTGAMFGFHCFLYILFRRLGYQKRPKNWGVIYDQGNKKPLGRVITRIYDKQYNKLLETRVTDGKGRYSFLVNNNIYYVTAEKLGYGAHKSQEIDLIHKDVDTVVGSDIALNKLKAGEKAESVVPTPVTPTSVVEAPPVGKVGMPAATPPKQPAIEKTPIKHEPEIPAGEQEPTIHDLENKVGEISVGRESLEELMSTKEEIKDIKEEITEKKEELEKLEEKVTDTEESVDEKIDKLDEEKKEEVTGEKTPKDSGKTVAQELEDMKGGKKKKPASPEKPESNPEKNIFG